MEGQGYHKRDIKSKSLEAAVKYLLDTCILIDFLRGESGVYDILVSNEKAGLSMSTVTMMELVIGALNKREVQYIQKAFRNINKIYIDQSISEMAESFIVCYSKSHNLQIDDALIAATAIKMDAELVTLNVSDFRYIPGIRLYQFA